MAILAALKQQERKIIISKTGLERMGVLWRGVVKVNNTRTRRVLDRLSHKGQPKHLGGVEQAEPRERQQHIHDGQEARAAVL